MTKERRACTRIALALALGVWARASLAADSKPAVGAVAALPSPSPTPTPRPPDAGAELAVKYVRDSAEYATLTRMVYTLATRAVVEAAAAEREAARRAGRPDEDARLAVVLDVDETALDNSVYQLERAAYRLPFSEDSWSAWVARRAAGAVPGVADFIRASREQGVRVAWISNRDDGERSSRATRANLAAWGLWSDDDRLCLRHGRDDASKAARRAQVRKGEGACGFGDPARVAVYVGDQLGDFPQDDEPGGEAARATGFGERYFLLPDPMYGAWTNAVTRPLP